MTTRKPKSDELSSVSGIAKAGRKTETPVPEPTDAAAIAEIVDLDDPHLYLNRELTWLQFNQRVLTEAKDARTPLLERIKFAAIAGRRV